MFSLKGISVAAALCVGSQAISSANENVMLLDVPDYSWYAGCFGTASGNLMGYWDRNGFPNCYTGPTGEGLAPMNSNTTNAGIRSLWASKAGFDGRPLDQLGHLDDYWTTFVSDQSYSYESTAADPYVLAGRPEHQPDCTSDFMGASQNKWSDLDGECSGNIDGFAFNFWDKQGQKRINFTPPDLNGLPVLDIQSGLRNWAHSRGYEADVFSQLADFNTTIPPGTGFTFEDLKAEINAGYPVMLFLQNPGDYSRVLTDNDRANPRVHAMIAYGYIQTDPDLRMVRYRTSWAEGTQKLAIWGPSVFETGLRLRGVIGFHPKPKLTKITPQPDGLRLNWDGPAAQLKDNLGGGTTALHRYVIEKSDSLDPQSFTVVTEPTTAREVVIPNCCGGEAAFFRVKLLPPGQ